MNISPTHVSKRTLLIAAAVSVLAGCGMWQQQQPPANVSSAPPAAMAPATAQNQPAASAMPAATRPKMSPAATAKIQNRNVLTSIHQTDMMEIALGKMAEEKASSEEVRAYADKLVKDHTDVDQMVIEQAPKTGIDLQKGAAAERAAREVSAREKIVEKKLGSAKGPEFDRRFLHQASAENLKLIRKLKEERETARNDDVEVTIDKTIPVLEDHKKQAQMLLKKEQAEARPSAHTAS